MKVMRTTVATVVAATLSMSAFSVFAEASLTGAGATFPAPVYAKWADTYQKETGNKVNYQGIGSSGGVKQIKTAGAPAIFHSSAQREVAQKTYEHQQNVPRVVGEHIGKQSPYLPPQNQRPVKAQHVIEGIALIHHTEEIHNGGAHGDIQHQIGNTLVSVAVAETLKTVS